MAPSRHTAIRFHVARAALHQKRGPRDFRVGVLTPLKMRVGIIGMMYGYPPAEALFEAVSATANAGLTCGVTQPDMPLVMKLSSMAAMWVGRLEFMSALTFFGYAWAIVRGVRGR